MTTSWKLFKSLLFWFFLAIVFKQILWLGMAPLWQFPDEVAHFSQVQNTIEFGINSGRFTSDEIVFSEKKLGMYPDKQGLNSYSFHPEYNIQYSDTIIGIDEQAIRKAGGRRTYEDGLRETSSYPFLYYVLSGQFYSLSYHSDLITRVFTTRLFSVFIFTATVGVAYLIGKTAFKDKLLAVTFASLLAFQPMFSFMGAAVNSDVLFNFIFTLFLYGCVRVLKSFEDKLGWMIVVASLCLGVVTKQQMVIGILIFPFVLVYHYRALKRIIQKKSIKYVGVLVLSLVLIVSLALVPGNAKTILNYIRETGKGVEKVSLWRYLYDSLLRTYRVVLPWYWGVFKWLGVTLPRWVNRAQMLTLLTAGLGIEIYWIKKIAKKTFQVATFSDVVALFSIYATLVYFLGLTLWDWQFRNAHGYSFELQGRYFFPVIATHMYLIIYGLAKLCEALIGGKYLKVISGVLVGWWIVLHSIGLKTFAEAYFSLSSWNKFSLQASQYKPALFKGDWWYLWVGFAGTSIFFFYWLFVTSIFSKSKT